ncbi:45 kDa calcium-binding protein [Contarinia nasturtii]|uniref:45 kDa calcium-binding protein n=1 Tax=Contarinia nasturtii TaxID=265458 RepID=UPI0012D4B74A|nr:45 kDa calcium-binding protein [Contarinia nasturtii]
MKIPINRLTKLLKSMPKWSTTMTVTVCLYVLFIMVVLSISFPLKSSSSHKIGRIEHNDRVNDIAYLDDDANGLGQNEQKLLQRARDLPTAINRSDILRDAFKKADLDGDDALSLQELARYINRRIRTHIEASIRNNPIIFSEIDQSPRNGLITWDEYYTYFLKQLGYDDAFIQQIDRKRNSNLDRNTKDLLIRDKALWNEAARTDTFFLTLDEFLAFKHPESSAANLLSLVDDLLRQFDEDGDDHLTMDEFSNVVADDLDDKWRQYMIEKNTFQRQEEFKRLIDKNHDGVADRSELLTYVSPKHPRHALQEAAILFNIADLNKDQKLSLQELESAGNVFMVSRMINTSQTFHDDFR